MMRNKEKQDAAVRKLEEDTQVLLDELARVQRSQRSLAGDKCDWCRRLLQVFFDEAAAAHDGDLSEVIELLDTGAASGSVAESLVAGSKCVTCVKPRDDRFTQHSQGRAHAHARRLTLATLVWWVLIRMLPLEQHMR